MAREHGNLRLDIWTDQHWRELSVWEQWLYMLLLSHPSLSYAGVADWRPGRIAPFASGVGTEELEQAAQALQSKHFILIDEDTEEVMIRSFLKHDGVLKQPRLAVSMVNAYGSVASGSIRKVIIHELKKIIDSTPGWKGLEDERVRRLTKQPSAPIEEFAPKLGQGFTPPFTQGFGLGFGPNGGQALGSHTSTSTTTSLSEERDPKERETETFEDQLEQWWEQYPKKVDKGQARKAFKAALKKTNLDTLIEAAQGYARYVHGKDRQFIKNPSTWLNAEAWDNEDEQTPARPATPERPTVNNPGAFTTWSSDDYRPWADRPHVIEAQHRVDTARQQGEQPNHDDLATIAGPDR